MPSKGAPAQESYPSFWRAKKYLVLASSKDGARDISRPADRKALARPRTVCPDADVFTRTS